MVVDLRYFKLLILLDQIISVWNIKDLHHQILKIQGLENSSLCKRLYSFENIKINLFLQAADEPTEEKTKEKKGGKK